LISEGITHQAARRIQELLRHFATLDRAWALKSEGISAFGHPREIKAASAKQDLNSSLVGTSKDSLLHSGLYLQR
jgi:hypothetical protein